MNLTTDHPFDNVVIHQYIYENTGLLKIIARTTFRRISSESGPYRRFKMALRTCWCLNKTMRTY